MAGFRFPPLRVSSAFRHSAVRSVVGGSLALLGAVLVACGGGGGSADTSSPQSSSSSYAAGSISGFGSVIVNGVRFDDSAAAVLDDDGNSVSHDLLKLGTEVEIEGGAIDHSTAKATALRIRIGSEVLGPVEAVDTAQSQLTVLGQTVEVNSATAFDSNLAGGLAAVQIGQTLEVHAQLDTARSVYVASRIELETDATVYKLRGVVANLDTSAKTFQIGSAVISYANVAQVPGNLANGARLKVRLDTTQVDGMWIATSLDAGLHQPDDHVEAEVKGFITAWTSATQFSVNGLAVDASAASFPDGQDGVVLGALVEVEGTVSNGVLVATKVSLEGENHRGHGEDFELHGALSALDLTAQTFLLRGVTVDFSAVTRWDGLTLATLADGLQVEVKGDLSADGTHLVASRISLDD